MRDKDIMLSADSTQRVDHSRQPAPLEMNVYGSPERGAYASNTTQRRHAGATIADKGPYYDAVFPPASPYADQKPYAGRDPYYYAGTKEASPSENSASPYADQKPYAGRDPYYYAGTKEASPSENSASPPRFPGSSDNCILLSIFCIMGLVFIAVLLVLTVGYYDYSSNTEEAIQITFALNMMQRAMLIGTRATALCLASKQVQCAADGLGAAACNATPAELDALCPLPAELLNILAVSDVESALDETSTSNAESFFASQLEEVHS